MKNITKNIKKAISTEVLWSIDDFYSLIEALERNNLEIDFTEEDEDRWAQVVLGDIIIAYVWKKYPLMFVKAENAKALTVLTEGEFNYLQIIVVEDLTANVLCLDIDKELMDRIGYFFDHKSFSANDFWFYNQA